jgi:probable addiction module antidote protein
MPLKTTPWDSADYLRTEEDRASYLAAVLEEAPDDAAFITNALGTVARARNMSQLARDTGLTREGLYKALSAGGNPSFGTVLKVMRALGVRLTVSAEPHAKPPAKPPARKQAKPAAKRGPPAPARRSA